MSPETPALPSRLAMLVDIVPKASGLAGISWWVWLAAAMVVFATAAAIGGRRARRSRAAPVPVKA